MKTILLITGPAGDAQGWGNLQVTHNVCKADQAKDLIGIIRNLSTALSLPLWNGMARHEKNLSENKIIIVHPITILCYILKKTAFEGPYSGGNL
jgi:hypothetical protein